MSAESIAMHVLSQLASTDREDDDILAAVVSAVKFAEVSEDARHPQGIEARSDETRSGSAVGESPVGHQADAPADLLSRLTASETARKEALARAERAEKALEFYANLDSFKFSGWQGDMDPPPVFVDRGALARAALAHPEPVERESHHDA